MGPVPISKTYIGTNCCAIRIELYEDINQRKCIWKYHLQNGGHFVLAKWDKQPMSIIYFTYLRGQQMVYKKQKNWVKWLLLQSHKIDVFINETRFNEM